MKKNLTVNGAASGAPLDANRRLFLKVLGVTGLGFLGTMLLPKRADALVFGSTPASNVVGVKNAANARVNPATEDTLALIKTNSDKFQFDVNGKLLTATTGGGGTDPVGLKDTTATAINPATEESSILLRRLVKQVESLTVVDSAQRQRVAVESAVISSGTITTVTTVTTVATTTTLNQLAGVDAKYFLIDTARNAYANGIRTGLVWS